MAQLVDAASGTVYAGAGPTYNEAKMVKKHDAIWRHVDEGTRVVASPT